MFGGFPEFGGDILGGPNNRDCNILGSILGFAYFGKLPFRHNKGYGSMWMVCGGSHGVRRLVHTSIKPSKAN